MTVVCVGSGPSTTADDFALLLDQHVIAINDTWTRIPSADVLYSGDARFWAKGDPPFGGLKMSCVREPSNFGAVILDRLGIVGWSDDPRGVYTGHHSGYQAIQVARQRGASRIVLLGYDMLPTQDRPTRFKTWLPFYAALAAEASRRRIEILNASRETALTVFRRVSLASALGL